MQLRKSGHPHIEVILAYYCGCNSQDFDLMMSTFTPDIVHYFVDHSAVVGADRASSLKTLLYSRFTCLTG